MKKYVIGIDFGTLSGRAVIADPSNGDVIAEAVRAYEHGVLEERLPSGKPLPEHFALADVHDYEAVLFETVKEAVLKAGIKKEAVIGIGIDVTSSTFLPLTEELKPLQDEPVFSEEPHAFMKIWKHHGAQEEADLITALMNERKETFALRCGGIVNAEWMLPKLLEIYHKAPEVYEKTACFIEAGDYLNLLLTKELTRSEGPWGYKMIREEGDPDRRSFYEALDPGFTDVEDKCTGKRIPLGSTAGYLTEEAAEKLGLPAGIPVAAANIDAHVCVTAAGIRNPGEMLAIIGTTCCAVVLSEKDPFVPGISGCVKNGALPGLYAYEAGQSAVGDAFSWFAENCVPEKYTEEAKEKGISLQDLLTQAAARKRPGETGLMALDWWNGNRSHLSDADLSGLLLGMTLTTRPEDLYRALLESIAYGLREIRDNYVNHGVAVDQVIACGGIPKKNPLLMQIYADVLNCEIKVAKSLQASALGSAIFASVAAGSARGGYDDVYEAAEAMGHTEEMTYRPVPENARVYEALFREFKRLHDYFGTGINPVMKHLKKVREEA